MVHSVLFLIICMKLLYYISVAFYTSIAIDGWSDVFTGAFVVALHLRLVFVCYRVLPVCCYRRCDKIFNAKLLYFYDIFYIPGKLRNIAHIILKFYLTYLYRLLIIIYFLCFYLRFAERRLSYIIKYVLYTWFNNG